MHGHGGGDVAVMGVDSVGGGDKKKKKKTTHCGKLSSWKLNNVGHRVVH